MAPKPNFNFDLYLKVVLEYSTWVTSLYFVIQYFTTGLMHCCFMRMCASSREWATNWSWSLHPCLQTCPQGGGHFHCRWSPSGLWACRHPLLGFPASGRRICAWHRHHGKAYWQRPPHVMCGHDQRGGRGLCVIWNTVFQHSKIIIMKNCVFKLLLLLLGSTNKLQR